MPQARITFFAFSGDQALASDVVTREDMNDDKTTKSAESPQLEIDERAAHAGTPSDDEIHPAAEIFPPLEGEEFIALVDDIKRHGLREPIMRDTHGRILDGRNRLRACRAAGVEPQFETWNGEGSPVDYVVSANLRRRHLDQSQRAMVAARLATMPQGARTDLSEISGRLSQAEAASLMKVSPESVGSARKVISAGHPALVEAVARGLVPVSAAAKVANLAPDEQRQIVSEGRQAVREAAKRARSRFTARKPRAVRTDSELVLTRAEKDVLQEALRAWARDYNWQDGPEIDLDALAAKLGIYLGVATH
jgi:ParB-like chromosome segregation protein Spo0J